MEITSVLEIKDLGKRKEFLIQEINNGNINIDDLINECTRKVRECYNNEQAIKIQLNSSYGAIASQYFVAYNRDVAESITLQGQDLIKYSESIINNYFRNVWHLDKELHSKMNITVSRLDPNIDVVAYIDTDSSFLNFKDIIKSTNWEGDEIDFILNIYENRLKGYFKKCFDIYANKRNTTNIQEFELENISKSIIFLAKKKYISDIVWRDPGIRNKSLEKIKPKGIEIVQGSTPLFARKKLKDLIKILFQHSDNFSIKEFNREIKKIKEEFMLSPIEDICKTTAIGDYEKYVLNDSTNLVLAPKCPKHIKGAGIYNMYLKKSKWKNKYRDIKSGDKVKWYPTPDESAFAFHSNAYPAEFSPQFDYESQFSSIIIDPINRFIYACGWTPIKDSLVTYEELF